MYVPRDCAWITRVKTQPDSPIKKRNQLISRVNFKILETFYDQRPSVFQESIWRSEGAIFSGYGERQMEQNFQHILSCCDAPVIAGREEAQQSYLPGAAGPA